VTPGTRVKIGAIIMSAATASIVEFPAIIKPFACTVSSAAAAACNYEEIRDRIVSEVVHAYRAADPECVVSCRVFAGVGKLLITGEVCAIDDATASWVDVEEAARTALRACARDARRAAPVIEPEYVI